MCTIVAIYMYICTVHISSQVRHFLFHFLLMVATEHLQPFTLSFLPTHEGRGKNHHVCPYAVIGAERIHQLTEDELTCSVTLYQVLLNIHSSTPLSRKRREGRREGGGGGNLLPMAQSHSDGCSGHNTPPQMVPST